MKKRKVKSLSLNKKAISTLQDSELKGGRWTASCFGTCAYADDTCYCTDTWCFMSIKQCPL